MKYRIELVWNREFDWANYGKGYNNLNTAIEAAKSIRDSGDGARVKKIRIMNDETGKIAWDGYKKI